MFFKTDSKLEQENNLKKQNAIVENELVFGLFKGLHGPFNKSLYPQYSPIHGSNDNFVRNLRLHGHFGPLDKGLPRPNWDGKDPDNFPQTWTASLLEFIAPSYIGFLFDCIPSTPFHCWLQPHNIALIFNALVDASFYKDPIEAVIKLSRCLQPEANFLKIEQEENKRIQFKQAGTKYGAFSKLKCLSWPTKEQPFTEILFNAFNESKKDGTFIVERILLTYMWSRKKSKIDLKPFYENLSNKIIHQSDIDIVWSGKGSYYAMEDYHNLLAIKDKNPNIVMSPEQKTLIRLGRSFFDGTFPHPIDYGVSVIKIDGKWVSFSDCGEISLLNYFMIALYNAYTRQFNWRKFDELEEKGFSAIKKLVFFFKKIYTSPICDFTPEIRNAWAYVLSDLNKGNSGNNVIYLKNKCCIAPGLDNILNVMNVLLPSSTKQYTHHSFLELLNLKNDTWFYDPYLWGLKTDVHNRDNLTLIFSKGGFDIFEWHFQKEHFDYNRIEHSKKRATRIYYLKNVLQTPEINQKEEFLEYLFEGKLNSIFAGNLNSIEGKCHAICDIFWFKNKFNNDSFDYLIHRWLEPTGKYFAGWQNVYTNKVLVELLMIDCHLGIDDIVDLNIPALTQLIYVEAHSESKPNTSGLSL